MSPELEWARAGVERSDDINAGGYLRPHDLAGREATVVIRTVSSEGLRKIELHGNLAAMLKAAHAKTGASLAPLGCWEDERSPDDDDLVQTMLVAGARNRRYLQLWSGAA